MKKQILGIAIAALSASTTAFAAYGPTDENQFVADTISNEMQLGGVPVHQIPAVDISPLLTAEMATLIDEMTSSRYADASSEAIADVNESMGFAKKCTAFASRDDMGSWGRIIVSEMTKNRPAAMMAGSSDLTASCSSYRSLSEQNKALVWVMVLNSMAHLESSCKTAAPAKGPNGSLVGLLQLHKGSEHKYAKGCRKGDGETSEGTFRCGIKMLNLQMKNREALFARASYWDVLRPQAKSQKFKKIKTALSKFSVCKG